MPKGKRFRQKDLKWWGKFALRAASLALSFCRLFS